MTVPSDCPSCGTAVPAAGARFCMGCGAALGGGCPGCGHAVVPGARFCNGCGAPLSAAAPVASAPAAGGRPGVPVPWVVAGGVALALAGVAAFALGGRGEDAPAAFAPAGTAAAGPGAAGAVDLSAMSPREAADRLFNRVMETVSSGDTAQARFFLPMALQAYERVPEADDDLRYHVGELHLLNEDADAARAQADAILAGSPDHLFGLYVAARAERMKGNGAAAGALYRRFTAAYTAEVARDLPEYRDHAQALPSMRAEAAEGGAAAD